jgi:UDP-N-acetylmuramoylalanine--D-glutamate ligase
MADPCALFADKKITVMGLGLLGRGLGDTLFLVRCGARVTVTDLKTAEQLAPSVKRLEGLPVTLRLGKHDPTDFIDADMILRNADVPRSSPYLTMAEERGIPVEMDESLFCKHFRGRVVGITGTRGKTTTTTLVHRILSATHQRAFLAGNIMGCATLPLLEQAGENDTVVLELSSWQLQGFHDARMSPDASVFTNIYPDHLNRYNGMDDYIADKKAIFLYQKPGSFCVFNGEQPESIRLAEEAVAEKVFFRPEHIPADWKTPLPGTHNRENVAAALCVTRKLGIPEEVIRAAVESFQGVEHRLQLVTKKRGVEFINDSTSTTPVAGCAALNALEGRRIFLIAGGSDKRLDLTPFAEAAASRAHRIALLQGTATDTLREAIIHAGGASKIAGTFDDLRAAVLALFEETRPEDVLLLSPACASFGMFQNEFHRGDCFISVVREIPDNDRRIDSSYTRLP